MKEHTFAGSLFTVDGQTQQRFNFEVVATSSHPKHPDNKLPQSVCWWIDTLIKCLFKPLDVT